MSRRTYWPYVKVTTPLLDATTQVTGLKLYLRENKHPVAQLDTLLFGQRSSHVSGFSMARRGILPEGTPVALSFGRDMSNSGTWYGYVLSKESSAATEGTAIANQPRLKVSYLLNGCTHLMQSQSSRAWIPSTRSYRSRELINSYGLRPHVEKSGAVQPGTAQNATSDFKFLVQMASDLGRRVVVDNSDVYVTNPLVSLRAGEAVPAFQYTDLPGVTNTMYRFSNVTGSLDPLGGRFTRQESFGFNTSTGHISRVVAERGRLSGFTTLQTSADNASHALAADDASGAADTTGLWVTASASVLGDARLKPGLEVLLSGSGLDKKSRGLWMVKEAVHEFQIDPNSNHLTQYTADLVVGRNAPEYLATVDRTRALYDDADVASRTVLRGNRWVSTFAKGDM